MAATHPLASFIQLIMAQHDEMRRHPRPARPRPTMPPVTDVTPVDAPTPAASSHRPLIPRQIDLERARSIRA